MISKCYRAENLLFKCKRIMSQKLLTNNMEQPFCIKCIFHHEQPNQGTNGNQQTTDLI